MEKLTITKNNHDQTLIKFLKKEYKYVPYNKIFKLIRDKEIRINDRTVSDPNFKIMEGDVLTIYGLDGDRKNKTEKNFEIIPTKIDFHVAYEDDGILIADKPFNLAIHDPSHDDLDTQVLYYLHLKYKNRIPDEIFPYHVNRIDKRACGLVIYAKNREKLLQISEIINDKTIIEKKYLAWVEGKADFNNKVVKVKLLTEDLKVVVSPNGKETETIFNTIRYIPSGPKGNVSLVECKIITGRKHQIRVTLQHLGHPIVGDSKYGARDIGRDDKFALCASSIKIENKEFISDYKKVFESSLKEVIDND